MSEDKPTSAAELTKLSTKTIKCKSGHVYRIRKMPLPVMATFFNTINMNISQSMEEMEKGFQAQLSNPANMEKLILAMRSALPHCIMEPQVSETLPSNETIINVDDIPIEDQFELFGTITDFSGLGLEKIKENETFRKERGG